jgi:hypothetical protein
MIQGLLFNVIENFILFTYDLIFSKDIYYELYAFVKETNG